jgi:hypothetical protein
MKKHLLILMAFALMFSVACNKDEEEAGQPGEITITTSVNDNVVTYTASATDAVKFIWDLGNGETPEGATVTGTYSFPGDYTIKCTAKGRETDRVKTFTQKVENGDPNVFNEVNKTLCGYDDATGESTTTWVWVDAANMMGDGPREGTPDTVYFNPIDHSWWNNGEGELPEGGLDDEYSFKLNKTMTYVNDFKDEFMVNWAWAASRGYAVPDIWDDLAYDQYNSGTTPAEASWSVRHIPNINDTLQFETNINGTMMPGAYVIELTDSASIGLEAAGNEYQILKLTKDTLWIRFDNTFPEDLVTGGYYSQTDLDAEGVTPGEPDETYLKLARKQ